MAAPKVLLTKVSIPNSHNASLTTNITSEFVPIEEGRVLVPSPQEKRKISPNKKYLIIWLGVEF
jgi:hypothetical protein